MISINRCALTLIAKQPLLNWIHTFEEDGTINLSNLNDDPNIYLVPENDYTYEYAKWVSNNYLSIIENEFSEWCSDKNKWPKNLSFDLFNEYYDFKISEVVYDLADNDIEKED